MKPTRAASHPDVGVAIGAFLWFGLVTTLSAAAAAGAHFARLF